MKTLDAATMAVLVIGGLNWLLVGLFEFDLVAWIFGGMDFGETNVASRIVYVLVGLCQLYWVPRLPALLRASEGAVAATWLTLGDPRRPWALPRWRHAQVAGRPGWERGPGPSGLGYLGRDLLARIEWDRAPITGGL